MNEFSAQQVRNEFPIFAAGNNYYLDSAATAQKPKAVLDSMHKFYCQDYANVHRGIYKLSAKATFEYEKVRSIAADFLGCTDHKEIIFTYGTTDAMNLIAYSLGLDTLQQDDEIVVCVSEHHSNIVPWQLIAKKTRAKLKFITLDDDYRIDLEHAKKIITKKTKIVSLAHVSNVTGAIQPIHDIITLAKKVDAYTIIDGAQGAVHLEIDVQKIGCDFYVFSAHKLCGPNGVGVLWGKRHILEKMTPFRGGGEMITKVTQKGSTWAELPHKFEAGTPPIAQVIGLGAALQFINSLPRAKILEHERDLGNEVCSFLASRERIKVYRPRQDKHWVGIVSFYDQDIHPHDLAAIQDDFNVAIRAGHHCAQILMNWFQVEATVRLSPFMYNTNEDIHKFMAAYKRCEEIFNRS